MSIKSNWLLIWCFSNMVFLCPLIFSSCVSLVSLCSLLRMLQQGRSTFAAPAIVCSSAKSLPRGLPVPGHIGEVYPSPTAPTLKVHACLCTIVWDCRYTTSLCKQREVKQSKWGAVRVGAIFIIDNIKFQGFPSWCSCLWISHCKLEL